MTEAEWLSCRTVAKMIRALGRKMTGRKLQLFVCGVCRLLGDAMPNDHLELVRLQERLVDGELETDDYHQQVKTATAAVLEGVERVPRPDRLPLLSLVDAVLAYDPRNGLRAVQEWGEEVATFGRTGSERTRTRAAFRLVESELLRDLFTWPGVDYVIQPEFVGGGILFPDGSTFHIPETARAIALGVQQDQAFDRLPILADALEDANCRDRPLLDHLRHGQNHRRGCWALDMVLGRG